MGKLLFDAIGPYKVIPKGLDRLLGDSNNYNKLVTGNTLGLNQQRAITLINVSDPDFFSTAINLTPKVDGSISIPISVFFHQHCKVMAIKRTTNTPELGIFILITNDAKYPLSIKKLDKLFKFIQKTPIINTIKMSLQIFSV